jgi:DnaJ-domain-containing protein 1
VSGVSAAGLTALVSDYQGSALEELSWADLLQSLLIHQRVLEGAMAQGPLLPVKFGTVLASPEEIETVLTRYQARFLDAFSEVGDAVEIDLSATWDEGAVLADVAPVAAVQSADGPDVESLEDRIRLGSLVAERLEQRRDKYRQRAVSDLAPLARDLQSVPRPTDELVFNLAFLVEREDLDRFEAGVDRLGEDLGDRLSFRYVGPLPPYSFASVELTHADPAVIASALQTLELSDRVSPAELRRVYRDLAAAHHPDRNLDDPEAQERFSSLAAAHESLEGYIRGQRETVERPDESRLFDLTPQAVADTVLLEIARADVEPRPRRTTIHEPQPAG